MRKRNIWKKCLYSKLPSVQKKQISGRSMIEMLAVLVIIGVLTILSIAGFRYVMDKYKSNSLYDDVRLLALHVIETRKDILPTAFSPVSGLAFSIDTKTYAKRFVVKVEGVPEGVCKKIISVQDTLIDDVYVGTEGIKTCFGSQTMGFIVFYNGKYALGGGTSGDTGNTGDTGDTGEVDPCKGIVVETNCGISEDIKDGNGCVLVEKISCSPGRYCLGRKCELCPESDTCSGEVCCSLTGRNDVCGNPTKEFGTISIVTHSDLNSNGCCVTSTEESCSLNPITPRTCTPTCEGTCQSDGTCRPNCNVGETYNEIAGLCCEVLVETDCKKLTPAFSGVCPHLDVVSTFGFPCTTEEGQPGTCQGDGTCRLNCNEGESYNERAEKCCPDLTVPVCHELTPGSLDVCPTLTYLSMDASPCTTEDGQEGKCREGVCVKK